MAANTTNALLVQAYLQALSQNGPSRVGRDPVKNVIFDEAIQIDHQNLFSFLDGGGFASDTINTVNIENAATLYGIMIIGDEMGAFRVADAIMKYATIGRIDVASSTTATRLYGYMKLRDQRTTAEERAMFYRQVFDMGSGSPMDQMVTNSSFWPLMESLVHHVIEYIHKYETAEDPGNISQASVRQIIRDLQHNLSRAASGMCKIFIPEMYAHLEDAVQIISAPEIRDQLGQGVARDLWNVIEQVSMEEFGHFPNTSALRTVASTARDIILDLARYTDATFDNTDFQHFVENVEAFIIAQSQVEGQGAMQGQRNGSFRSVFHRNGEKDPFENQGDGYGYGEPEPMEEDWSF